MVETRITMLFFFLMVASYPWLLDAIAARVVDLALNQSQTLETNT